MKWNVLYADCPWVCVEAATQIEAVNKAREILLDADCRPDRWPLVCDRIVTLGFIP